MMYNYYAGDIVKCYYTNLSGEREQGLFCIIYCEKYDTNTECGNNIVALKITSQKHEKYHYYCELKNDRLYKQSRICCTKPYIFKYQDIIHKLDNINENELLLLKDKLSKFMQSVYNQLDYEISFRRGGNL